MSGFWRSIWLLAAAAVLCACSVQLVSPYNTQLADGLTKLHDDVLKLAADVVRNGTNPATRAKAAYDNYGKTYDDFHARIETMRVISDVGNPGIVNCPQLLGVLQGAARKGLEESEGTRNSDSNVDCQTYLLVRLNEMVGLVEQVHRIACAPANPNFRNDCLGGFGAASGAIRFGENSNGLIIQPTLTTIRTLMWVQEAKKPKK